MGQHTWFVSDKEKFLKQLQLYELIQNCSEELVSEIYKEIDKLEIELNTPYHDLFRTCKKQEDNSYTEEILSSHKETLAWINNPENLVYFSFTNSQELAKEKHFCMVKLKEFWEKYPEGLIYFG